MLKVSWLPVNQIVLAISLKSLSSICPHFCCLQSLWSLCLHTHAHSPGPREIPGCTGGCQLTYCKACIFNRDEVSVPDVSDCPECSDIADYSRPSSCYLKWSRCAGRQLSRANRVGISCSH